MIVSFVSFDPIFVCMGQVVEQVTTYKESGRFELHNASSQNLAQKSNRT